MKTIKILLQFEERYIAHPYWTEKEDLINLEKKSGMASKRTEESRRHALATYLEQQGMSMDAYEELKKIANREWYTAVHSGEIIIPKGQFSSALVNACYSAPQGAKIDPTDLRSLIYCSDLSTGKMECDGVWSRPIQPKGPNGKPLSNQRKTQSNQYITGFKAAGTITYCEDNLEEEKLRNLIHYCGRWVGVGACRKMGCGRFVTLLPE